MTTPRKSTSGPVDTDAVGGNPLVEIREITKRFNGVLALDHLSFEIQQEEVLALLGENGAGKSTIIKILSGVHSSDEGEILVQGEQVRISGTQHANRLGITTIHQEHSLALHLNAIENVFLGRELKKGIFGVRLDERAMLERVISLGEEFDLAYEDLRVPVGRLGSLRQHSIEIIKALAFDSKLLIMDEPTSGLTDNERSQLFDHISRLRDRGTTILWVTHHLDELTGLADRAVVMKDGCHVGAVKPDRVGNQEIVRMMVGRDVESIEQLAAGRQDAHESQQPTTEEILRVEEISRSGVLDNVSFTLNKGEILGFSGLAGAGRTEIARAILGADKIDSGTVYLEGSPLKVRSPKDAVEKGIALLPEDRKFQGIFPGFPVTKSISAGALWKTLRARFLVDENYEKSVAQDYVKQLNIRTPSVSQDVSTLSGGNQQKTSLARALFSEPKVLIFDEPTQGIDVGAKTEVYRLIKKYVEDGGSAIVISSELPELLGLSDRILVIAEGQKVGEVEGLRATGEEAEKQSAAIQRKILSLATMGAE